MVPYGQGQSFSTGAVFTSRSIENAFSLMAAQYLGSDLILLYTYLKISIILTNNARVGFGTNG